MSIQFFCEDVVLPDLHFEAINRGLKIELRLQKAKLGEINYIFCSDEYLLVMNSKFLKHDFYTDVITFDYSGNGRISGDIFISTDRVLNNSVIFEQSFDSELLRVISHGLLHLLGFNDKEEVEIGLMRQKEIELLNRINSFF